MFEAAPMAFVMEQAGAAASNGTSAAARPGARRAAPARAGDHRLADEVERIVRYHADASENVSWQLFKTRSLFIQPQRLSDRRSSRMSRKHPIIAITGSHGAGTTPVTSTIEQIFRRESIRAAVIEGDAFHRYDRARDEGSDRARRRARATTFSHFGPDANLCAELEELFRTYGANGRGQIAPATCTTTTRPRRCGRSPAPSRPGTRLPAGTDLLFYEGLHGGVVRPTTSTSRRHADLMVGVVPIINLEWIQKMHRDRATRGY